MGTVTGNLLSPACGDLSGTPSRVVAGFDSATVILPLLIRYAATNPIVRAWNEWVIICLIFIYCFVAIFSKNHKKFYGIKIVLPLVSAGALLASSIYWNFSLPKEVLGITGTVGLAFVAALVISDFGIEFNEYIRSGLVAMQPDLYLNISVQVMLISISLYLLISALQLMYPNWLWLGLSLVIVLVSITRSSRQKGSIVSAGASAFLISAIGFGFMSVALAIVVCTLYNNFILNRDVDDKLGDIPLLDTGEPHAEEDLGDVRFRLILNALLLSAILTEKAFAGSTFITVGLVSTLWVLVAPFVLSSRDF